VQRLIVCDLLRAHAVIPHPASSNGTNQTRLRAHDREIFMSEHPDASLTARPTRSQSVSRTGGILPRSGMKRRRIRQARTDAAQGAAV
jgi:hypothetical protein